MGRARSSDGARATMSTRTKRQNVNRKKGLYATGHLPGHVGRTGGFPRAIEWVKNGEIIGMFRMTKGPSPVNHQEVLRRPPGEGFQMMKDLNGRADASLEIGGR